jgi:hypothetical protein
MTILGSAYSLCKHIMELPIRQHVANLLHRMNSSAGTAGSASETYSDLGRLGRQERAQFAGYLAAAERFGFSWGRVLDPGPHGCLQTDELDLLAQAHQFLLEINARLLGRVSARIPGLARLVDPYCDFAWLPSHCGSREYDIQSEPIEGLCQEFGHHPAWKVVLSTSHELETVTPKEAQTIRLEVDGIIDQIRAAGCAKAPCISRPRRMAST